MKNILKTIGLVFGLGLFMQACDDCCNLKTITN